MLDNFDYPGVYGLSVDGKIFYVGSSKNIKKRVDQHFALLRKGNHKRELQEAYNVGKNVVPICLEKMTDKNTIGDLYSKEMHWIDKIEPVCTERKPLYYSPMKSLYDLAMCAASEKERAQNAKYDYLRVYGENSENRYYAALLYHVVRYFTPLKNTNNGFTDKLYRAFVISPTYDDGKRIRAMARKLGITEEQYILEAIRTRIESESK